MGRVAAMLALSLFVASCSVDPNEQANKLFVEAQSLIAKAAKQEPEERFASLQAANEKLKSIVAEYPGSNLAVQLVAGQSVGTTSFKALSDAIAEAAWPVCLVIPKRDCIIDHALRLLPLIKDDRQQAFLLGGIAVAQSKAGLTKEAHATFEQALQIAQSLGVYKAREDALINVAGEQARADQIPEALKTAQMINDDNEGAQALRTIVQVQASAGDIAGSLQTAKLIRDDQIRDGAFQSIAEAQAKVGQTLEAIQTAQSINADKTHDQALQHIVEAQAKSKIPDALQTVRMIKSDTSLTLGLIYIACGKLTSADISEALNIAQTIKDDSWRAGALGGLAVAQSKAGLTKEAHATFEQALQITQELKDDQARSLGLQGILIQQAKVGLTKEVHATFEQAFLQTAQAIKENGWRAAALGFVAASHAGVDDLSGALQIAQTIQDDSWRVRALVAIANASTSAGFTSQVGSTLERANQAANSITNEALSDAAFESISEAQSRAGIFSEAINTAQSIRNNTSKNFNIQNIAIAQMRAGKIREALKTSETIVDDDAHVGTLVFIARGIPK